MQDDPKMQIDYVTAKDIEKAARTVAEWHAKYDIYADPRSMEILAGDLLKAIRNADALRQQV